VKFISSHFETHHSYTYSRGYFFTSFVQITGSRKRLQKYNTNCSAVAGAVVLRWDKKKGPLIRAFHSLASSWQIKPNTLIEESSKVCGSVGWMKKGLLFFPLLL
jgi:hypothetical protein